MRHSFKYIIGGAMIILVAASSCSKKIDEAYANPNAAVRQPIENIFPSLIGSISGSSSAAGSAYGLCNDGLLIGRYIQFWGTYIVNAAANVGSQYDKMGGVTDASDNLGSVWAAHYYGMGQNINKIVEWGNEEEKWDFVGAAWALRAWSMFECTNQYGEIILRQAFNQSLQQFTYESQQEVYDSVRLICHRALSYLNMTGGNMNPTTFAASDFYFNGGSLDRWKKFVYGILARSYAYLHNKTTYSADSVIKYADLYLNLTTLDDNITTKFQNTGITGTSNYYGAVRQNINNANTGIRQSAFIADLMTGANTQAFTGVSDPRAWYILREDSNMTIKGITPWLGTSSLALRDRPFSFIGTEFSSTGYPYSPERGTYIFRNNAEWPVMTTSEILFLKAEAALRKTAPDPATSLAAYTTAISLNFDMLTTKYNANIISGKEITPAMKTAYLGNTAVVPAAATEMTLTRIMLQKYIAMYGWGMHNTWVDMRRYHYTDIDPATSQQVYAGFVPPSGTNLFTQNLGKLVYRTRPRYNSEYLYNIPALTAIGAFPTNNDYHTKQCWFSQP